MKKILLIILMIISYTEVEAEAFKNGSYIVDWGVQPQTYENGLYPYGLLFDLVIRNEIPVYWIIKQGKPLMGTDFSYNGKDYMGSALVIPAIYVNSDVLATIDYWKNKGVQIDGPTPTDFDAPAYNYITSFPNAVVDQQNVELVQDLFYNHVNPENGRGIPSSYYITGTPKDITACSDVYALPHADPQDPEKWTSTEQGVYDSYIKNAGGFLWQGCHSVGAVEAHSGDKKNFLNMFILTTNGQIAWEDDPDYDFKNENTPPFSHEVSAGDNPIMQIADYLSHGNSAAQTDGSQKIYIPRPDSAWRPTTTVAVWDPDNVNLGLNGGNPNKAALIAFGRAYGNPNLGMVVQQASHTSRTGTEAENVSSARIYGNLLLQAAIEKRPNVSISAPNDIYYPNSYEMHADITRGTEPFTAQWSMSCGGDTNPGTFSNPSVNGRTATVTFTPNNVTLDNCILRVKVTDHCNRKNFDTKLIGITGYHPPLGYFNVTHTNENFASTGNQDPLLTTHPVNSLYTQISGKDFNVTLVALDVDKVTPVNSTSTALLELIDSAGVTELDPSSCSKAFSYATVGGFDFNGNKFINAGPIQHPYARHEAGFRVSYYDFTSQNAKTYGIPNDKSKADIDNAFPQCASSCITIPATDWGCYECISKIYGKSVCARDNFAIRPDHFTLNLQGTPPLIGGHNYPLEINASTFSGTNDIWYSDNIVNGVVQNRIFDAPNYAKITSQLILPATCTSLSASTPEVYQNAVAFIQGVGLADDGTTLLFSYGNVGDINLTATESKWVAYADMNKNYSGTSYEQNDCIVNSASNVPDADGKVGCVISGSTPIKFIPADIYNTLRISDFNTDGNFTYIASDEGTSTKYGAIIQISHTARLENGQTATNYTGGCFAHDVNVSFLFNNNSSLGWSDMQNRIWIYNKSANALLTKTTPANFNYLADESNFNAGVATLNMFFDFTRKYNIPDNPSIVGYADFNITSVYDVNDTGVTGGDFNKTAGNSNESNATFIYGRATSTKFLYGPTTQTSVKTPIMVQAYCDKWPASTANCPAIDLTTYTNERRWFMVTSHNMAGNDGNITLSASNGTVSPTVVSINTGGSGVDNNITVTGTASNTVNINFNTTNLNDTSKRLIYNKDADSIPAPFYQVDIIGQSGWTGEGKTGHVVGDDINNKQSKRLGW